MIAISTKCGQYVVASGLRWAWSTKVIHSRHGRRPSQQSSPALVPPNSRVAVIEAMRIDIVYFEAASGHKTAAEAVRYGLSKRHPDWTVRLVDLADILKCQTYSLYFIYTWGIRYFNWCMRRESYFFFTTGIRLCILFARLNTCWRPLRFLLRWTAEFWHDAPPDAVISVTPMKHTIVYEAARCVNPDVCCITIPVDYDEMTPGYWFQPVVKQFYLLGYKGLESLALAAGVPTSDIRNLSGMIVDPRFYELADLDGKREEILNSLGLDPKLATGLISFGGQGTVNVLRSVKRIAAARIPLNLICLCGTNKQLLEAVCCEATPYPVVALEFNTTPPVTVHRIAQFLIGKPGTMTLTEALITETPLIFVKSRELNVVHGGNEAWILDQGIGVMVDDPDSVDVAVQRVLECREIRERIAANRHTGIFDALDAIEDILKIPVA